MGITHSSGRCLQVASASSLLAAVFFRACSHSESQLTKEKYVQGFFLQQGGIKMLKNDHANSGSRKVCLGMERRNIEN